MLIGGNSYSYSGYGFEQSWLNSSNPEKYLMDIKYILDSKHDWHVQFLLPALQEKIPNFIFEMTWKMGRETRQSKKTIYVDTGFDFIVHFKTPEMQWKESQSLFRLAWEEIPSEWNKDWFLSKVTSKLEEFKKEESVKIQLTEKQIEFYSNVLKHI